VPQKVSSLPRNSRSLDLKLLTDTSDFSFLCELRADLHYERPHLPNIFYRFRPTWSSWTGADDAEALRAELAAAHELLGDADTLAGTVAELQGELSFLRKVREAVRRAHRPIAIMLSSGRSSDEEQLSSR
jgi:hypothetical protein